MIKVVIVVDNKAEVVTFTQGEMNQISSRTDYFEKYGADHFTDPIRVAIYIKDKIEEIKGYLKPGQKNQITRI